MPNSTLTPTVIANELLMRFENNLGFVKNVDHDYDEKFAREGAKIGDTFTLRDGARFSVVDGPDITSSIQDVTELSNTLVLNKFYSVPFKFSSKELTLNIDKFGERYLDGVSLALANAVDVYALTTAYQRTANCVGTPATVPADALTYLQAGQKLDEHSAPIDDKRCIVINPAMQTSIVDSLKGLLNASTQVSQQYVKGRMGTALGFDWYLDQNIRAHTNGAWAGTVTTSAAVTVAGSTSIAVTGLTAATAALKAGDVITVADCYDVNPVSGDTLPYLKQFVVTANISASSNAATVAVSPAMYATGPLKNCSAFPGNSKSVTLLGASGAVSPQGLAFHKHAFVLGMAPLMVPNGVHTSAVAKDPDTGMSVRIVSDYNVLTDDVVWRADILFGFTARRPEFACRIAS